MSDVRSKSIDSVGSEANLLDAIEKCGDIEKHQHQQSKEDGAGIKKSGEGKGVGRHSETEFDVDEDLKDLADVVEKHAEADEVLVDHTVLKLAQDCVNRSDQVYHFQYQIPFHPFC